MHSPFSIKNPRNIGDHGHHIRPHWPLTPTHATATVLAGARRNVAWRGAAWALEPTPRLRPFFQERGVGVGVAWHRPSRQRHANASFSKNVALARRWRQNVALAWRANDHPLPR